MNMRTQQGFGLTEVLVAVLLLSIGVIGFAGLQVRAITATNSSFQRSQATVIARDVSDRMRANMAARATYKDPAKWSSALSMPSPNCMMASCNAEQMAAFDIYQIRTLAATVGANGDARMENCSGNANVSCVYIAWGETTPKNAIAADANACMLNGIYQPSSECIMLETY